MLKNILCVFFLRNDFFLTVAFSAANTHRHFEAIADHSFKASSFFLTSVFKFRAWRFHQYAYCSRNTLFVVVVAFNSEMCWNINCHSSCNDKRLYISVQTISNTKAETTTYQGRLNKIHVHWHRHWYTLTNTHANKSSEQYTIYHLFFFIFFSFS